MTDGGFERAAAVSILLAPVILSEAADSRRESEGSLSVHISFRSSNGRLGCFPPPHRDIQPCPRFRIAITAEEDVLRKAASGRS